MMRACFQLMVVAALFWNSAAIAQSVDIPYKATPTSVEEYGLRVLTGTLVFLVIAGAIVYFLRRKNPVLTLGFRSNRRIKVIEHQRLNSQFSLYIIQFNQQELLIGQSGDNIVCLAGTAMPKNEGN